MLTETEIKSLTELLGCRVENEIEIISMDGYYELETTGRPVVKWKGITLGSLEELTMESALETIKTLSGAEPLTISTGSENEEWKIEFPDVPSTVLQNTKRQHGTILDLEKGERVYIK